jgi:hypothetical protein
LLVNGNQYFVTGATPAQGTGPFLRQRTLVCFGDAGDPITIQLNDGPGDFDDV